MHIGNQVDIPGWLWVVQRGPLQTGQMGRRCDPRSQGMLVGGECGVWQGAVGGRVLPAGGWQ